MISMKTTALSDWERYRRIRAIEDRLARQAKAGSIVLGIMATSGIVALILVLAFL
jgi:hypothetical protein